jgi:phage-related tail fiber protein
LKANGAAVSRTTYAALFAITGTTYGSGDGSTTFNVPDLRGEFIRGWADDRAVDTGRAFGSAQADELKSHTHGNVFSSGYAEAPNGFGWRLYPDPGTTDATGGTETRPRNVALLACIKF